MPQRKPEVTMTGKQLLTKALTGSHKTISIQEKKLQEIKAIIKDAKAIQ